MIRKLALALSLSVVSWPGEAWAQSPQSIFAEVVDRRAERWDTVRNYVMEELHEGAPSSVPRYFERDEGVEGGVEFRQVPIGGYEPVGGVREPENPFDSYLADMMTGDAPPSSEQDMASMVERTRLVGEEEVDGRGAFHLRADDLSDIEVSQPQEGTEVTLLAADFWIDTEEYVPLRTRLEMEVESDGRTAPVEIDMRLEAYERVGSLYEPTRQVTRISGLQAMMGAGPGQADDGEEAQQQLAEARQQLAEAEAQMDQIPEQFRGAVQGRLDQMRRQIETLEDEGVVESVLLRKVISVNEGPPSDWTPTLVGPTAP
jgi:hypothetical protein